MPESHNIWVHYMGSNHNNTFQGQVPSFSVLFFSWTIPNKILQILEGLPTGKPISSISKRFNKTPQWILCPQPAQNAVVISTMYKYLHGWADCVDGFIQVVKQGDKRHIVPVGAIVGCAHLVRVNSASDSIDSICLLNTRMDLDTYWTVYYTYMAGSWGAEGR